MGKVQHLRGALKARTRIAVIWSLLAPLILIGISNPQAAFAAPSVSLPATLTAGTSFTNVNSGGALSISGYNVGASIQVTVSATSGNLKIVTTTGLTAPTGYTSAAWTSGTATEIAFYGSQTDVSNALNSLQYKASAVDAPATITVTSFVAGAAYNSTTGHFYEIVENSSVISWELSRCKALYSNSDVSVSAGDSLQNNNRCTSSTSLTRRTLGGLQGYLATITTQAEHEFIYSKLTGTGWIGGADTDLEGTFIWMDGPERGQPFWNSSSTTRGGTNLISGSNRYNYFNTGEPNNAGAGEDFAEFGFGANGSWNDCQNGCNRTRYVIEYGEDGDVLSGASGTINVNPRTPVSTETDTAISLSGSQFLSSAQEAPFDIATGTTFTLEAWVRPSVTNAAQILLGKNNQYSLLINSNGSFGMNFYTTNVPAGCGGDSGIFGANSARANEWQHVAVVRSGSTVTGYLNGQPVGTLSGCSATDSIKTGSNSFVVGGYSTTDQPFTGQIDQVRAWSSARTAAELQSGMSVFIPSPQTNLIAAYGFNENTGAKVFNNASSAIWETDLNLNGGSSSWSQIAETSTVDAYSVVTFRRSYLTSAGGWRVPSGISRIQTLLVAGGGGGGGGLNGGGGGAGGFIETITSVSSSSPYSITVGAGGIGWSSTQHIVPTNGTNSSAFSLTAIGGGYGGVEDYYSTGIHYAPNSGGSGGGGSWGQTASYRAGASGTTGQGNTGGSNLSFCCTAAGGGGAGGVGVNTSSTKAGDGGPGRTSVITGTILGGGGGGASRNAGVSLIGTGGTGGGGSAGSTNGGNGNNGTANTGGGGGGTWANPETSGRAGNGGSGIIAVRWITATVPTYTKPTNAFLNVGMTETFTTNVAVDSATVGLTRTFTWESSTAGAGGPFTRIKSGTGAANAAFSWVPPDTSTSGSNYLYRLTVTDSDTAGLFITDSSTTFAVINPALRVTGLSAIPKAINLLKSETFTITLGTSTYRPTLSPVIPGITFDTSTAGFAVIKISETMTVGTYYETLTVVDSVSASVVLPLTIRVQAPPQLTNTGEIVADGQVFNLDFSNSSSYNPLSQAIADISGSKKTITAPNGGSYSNDFSGIYTLSATSSQYLTATAFSLLPKWTIETFIRLNATPTAQFCPFASEYASTSISMLLCVDAARTVFTGFLDRIGGVDKWSFKRSAETIPLNTWVHIVGTFDGSAANLYFDGVSTTPNAADGGRYDAGYVPPTPNTNRVFIGKNYPTAVGTTPNVSLGLVRTYSSGFTQAQVQQNFNATKTRFETLNQSQLKPSQKYGSLTLESFTATSGSDTKTVTFATGNRTGIAWDTVSTPGVVKLSVQESLTVGTYYDTATVTDNLGQSTYLPLSFTVTKADTITVTMNSPSALNYTGSTASFTPTLSITGLKNSDTATASSVTITQTRAGNTCAMGGSCAIGDRGPGGGIVFITPSTVSGNGKYFEAAPDAWYGTNDLSTVGKFCTAASNRDNTNEGATQSGIGWGETNTAIFRVNCTGGAVKLATDYRGGGFSNWFVPSNNELDQMKTYYTTVDLIKVSGYWGYWSSTENSSSVMKSLDNSGSWVMGAVNKSDSTHNMVRPVRMFTACHSVDSCTAYSSTTMPTNAGTYRLTPSALTLSSGDLSNYQGVTYASGLLTINKVNQTPITIGQYDAFPGISTYPLNVYGGTGTGVMRRTLTSAGTASCVLTNIMFITASTPGKCEVRVTKAADFNYNMETATATIYWIQFVNRYTNSGPTSPTDLALSGGTALEKRTYETFTVLSFANETGTAVTSIKANTKLRVIGTGFVAADGTTEVYFGIASVPSSGLTFNTLDPMANYVLLTVPADAETDRVLMYSAKGWATSPGTLTILP